MIFRGSIFRPVPFTIRSRRRKIRNRCWRRFRYIGIGRGDRVLNTFMYHLTPAGILLDEAMRACGATVIPTGPGNTELQIMMMMALGATGFVGQPSYLMTLLDKAAEMGMGAGAVPLKKALFSAEPYTPSQRERFEGEYGMKTTSAYGTADLGFIGYTREGVTAFCIMPSVYLQVCDPETGAPLPAGETGEIVATTLNKSYPLIRFGTGDLGALAPQPQCEGQQLLGLFGRSGDAIKVRGMFLHPNQLQYAVMQFPEIKEHPGGHHADRKTAMWSRSMSSSTRAPTEPACREIERAGAAGGAAAD